MAELKRTGDDVKRIKYRCSNRKCRAEDTGKFFENERIWPVIICWQCKAGSGLSTEQMMSTSTGMFPVPLEEQGDQPPQTPAQPS